MEPLHQWYRNLFQKIRESVEDNAKTTLGVIALEGFFYALSIQLRLFHSGRKRKSARTY